MIHHVPHQLKFKRLVRLLRPLCGDAVITSDTVAVGVLERLWHATIANAIQGNIGKLSDEDIAEAVGWLGDASLLIGALVDSGWVDRCEVHRLVVHDWHDHAPDFVRGNLSKHKREFAIATCHGHPAIAPCPEHVTEAVIPNLTLPNLTDLTDLTKLQPASQSVFGSRWEAVRERAERIKNAIDANHRLTAQNRELVLKLACLSELYSELADLVDMELVATVTKMNGPNPPKTPWGFLKSRVIAACKVKKWNFDLLWMGVDVPSDLLERRKQPC